MPARFDQTLLSVLTPAYLFDSERSYLNSQQIRTESVKGEKQPWTSIGLLK